MQVRSLFTCAVQDLRTNKSARINLENVTVVEETERVGRVVEELGKKWEEKTQEKVKEKEY